MWLPGIVEGVDPEDERDNYTLVKYMEKKGPNEYVWGKLDLLYTADDDLLCRVDPVVPVNNRTLGLNQDDLKKSKILPRKWFIFTFLFTLLFFNSSHCAPKNIYVYKRSISTSCPHFSERQSLRTKFHAVSIEDQKVIEGFSDEWIIETDIQTDGQTYWQKQNNN